MSMETADPVEQPKARKSRPRTREDHPGRRQRATPGHQSEAQRPRSAVTSGRKLFVDAGDPNSAWSRRYHDLVCAHARDLGGVEILSGAQMSLIRRASAIECELERLDARLSMSLPVDMSAYAAVSGHLRRIFETLGLKRTLRDITPDPLDYACEQEQEPA
jgi:hypothetical protein